LVERDVFLSRTTHLRKKAKMKTGLITAKRRKRAT
jgi:hypothetical protein